MSYDVEKVANLIREELKGYIGEPCTKQTHERIAETVTNLLMSILKEHGDAVGNINYNIKEGTQGFIISPGNLYTAILFMGFDMSTVPMNLSEEGSYTFHDGTLVSFSKNYGVTVVPPVLAEKIVFSVLINGTDGKTTNISV